MLRRLQSRHPIDLPRGAWTHKKAILLVLGGIAALFVVIPLGLSPLVALSASMMPVVIAIGAGFGTLVLVLVVFGARGKFGWQR